jgi:hypothetical protein
MPTSSLDRHGGRNVSDDEGHDNRIGYEDEHQRCGDHAKHRYRRLHHDKPTKKAPDPHETLLDNNPGILIKLVKDLARIDT